MGKPDINYISHADVTGVRIIAQGIVPTEGTRWDDALKFSNAHDAEVAFCLIYGGHEDCIDMNRGCSNIRVHGCDLHIKGGYGMTIKGGTHDVTIENCVFHGKPKVCDIDLGNWSDQSNEKVRRVKLINLVRSDGRPVVVRCLWSEKPEIIGGNVKLKVVPLWQVKIFRFFRGLFA